MVLSGSGTFLLVRVHTVMEVTAEQWKTVLTPERSLSSHVKYL